MGIELHKKPMNTKGVSFPKLNNGLNVAIYIQVSDIEEENNGLLTFDREILKVDTKTMLKINQHLKK